jgi:hypothetical protein
VGDFGKSKAMEENPNRKSGVMDLIVVGTTAI